jgi:hypothetical protein
MGLVVGSSFWVWPSIIADVLLLLALEGGWFGDERINWRCFVVLWHHFIYCTHVENMFQNEVWQIMPHKQNIKHSGES